MYTDPPKEEQISHSYQQCSETQQQCWCGATLRNWTWVEIVLDYSAGRGLVVQILWGLRKRRKARENAPSNWLVHISVQPSFKPRTPQLLSPEKPVSQGDKAIKPQSFFFQELSHRNPAPPLAAGMRQKNVTEIQEPWTKDTRLWRHQ